MKIKINKTQYFVLYVVIALIFSNIAAAADYKEFRPDKNFINKDAVKDILNKKISEHKRIILDSISIDDVKKLEEKGCVIKQKLQKATSFECPTDFDLQLEELKVREARIFHIVDLQSDQQIDADDVWAEGIEGNGVRVVILDTGVDYSHPELSDSYLGGYDFYNNDNDPADDHGHGTHVAGIITANSGDAKGVAPGAEFYMLKVCSADGLCPEDDMIAAMEYAITDLDAKIMSISIGGGNFAGSDCDSDPLAAEVNDVVDSGISVAVASGNDGYYISSPACASKAIAVGAVDDSGYVTYWSNYGPSLDITAPGVSIYSTLPGNSYASWSGTSMATPHVSGVIALLLDENPSVTDAEIKNALYSTANPATGCYRCIFVWNGRCYGLRQVSCTSFDTGAGIVNAYQAYLAVKQEDNDSDGDGVPDDQDVCEGYDDNADADSDGIPDGCDDCPNDADNDADQDGVCGDVDVCEGFDDNIDTVADGTPDGCDACTDVDEDSYCAEVDDCDDDNANINPSESDSNCDDVDNNCNGNIDEDYLTTLTNCGIGACASTGQLECINGIETDDCQSGQPASDDSICNNIDDDCNGFVDEDYISYTCGIGACEDQSICNKGIEICTPKDPSAEVCNGIDDDCNGIIDDGDVCILCVDNDNDGYGDNCELDTDCNDNDDTIYTGAPDLECNGIDNDCDSLIDEDYVITQTNCGIGYCKSTGQLECINGIEVDSCTPGTPSPDDSTCNNIDDDCDALVDEDYLTTLTSCGIGQCYAEGQLECQNGIELDTCQEISPSTEICDSLDNDCDGSIDEGDVCGAATKCWDGTNNYLRRSTSQFSKFCKCAEGNYAYSSISYAWGFMTAYQYIDAGDNENWQTATISNFFPAYRVRCSDGNWYYTNQDYFR